MSKDLLQIVSKKEKLLLFFINEMSTENLSKKLGYTKKNIANLVMDKAPLKDAKMLILFQMLEQMIPIALHYGLDFGKVISYDFYQKTRFMPHSEKVYYQVLPKQNHVLSDLPTTHRAKKHLLFRTLRMKANLVAQKIGCGKNFLTQVKNKGKELKASHLALLLKIYEEEVLPLAIDLGFPIYNFLPFALSCGFRFENHFYLQFWYVYPDIVPLEQTENVYLVWPGQKPCTYKEGAFYALPIPTDEVSAEAKTLEPIAVVEYWRLADGEK